MALEWKMERMVSETDCADGGEETKQYVLIWVTVGDVLFLNPRPSLSRFAAYCKTTDVLRSQTSFRFLVPLGGRLVTPPLLL